MWTVDLPGVGYAQASRDLRESWINLLRQYTLERGTLQVLCHLVDSRHGLMDADGECLDLLSTLPPQVDYVIVFTKVDKHRGSSEGGDGNSGINSGVEGALMRRGIVDRVYREVAKRTTRPVKIFFTSSESREGGVDLLSFIIEQTDRSLGQRQLNG